MKTVHVVCEGQTEALVFSNVEKLGEVYYEYDVSPLIDCISNIKNPELINDGEDTAPSKRIIDCIPVYDKASFGVQVLMESKLDDIRNKCKHFNDWVVKLENI